jgi:hypothetical protein
MLLILAKIIGDIFRDIDRAVGIDFYFSIEARDFFRAQGILRVGKRYKKKTKRCNKDQ